MIDPNRVVIDCSGQLEARECVTSPCCNSTGRSSTVRVAKQAHNKRTATYINTGCLGGKTHNTLGPLATTQTTKSVRVVVCTNKRHTRMQTHIHTCTHIHHPSKIQERRARFPDDEPEETELQETVGNALHVRGWGVHACERASVRSCVRACVRSCLSCCVARAPPGSSQTRQSATVVSAMKNHLPCTGNRHPRLSHYFGSNAPIRTKYATPANSVWCSTSSMFRSSGITNTCAKS